MNMMVWGRGCWFSNPDSLYSMLPNVLHVVLSTTLKILTVVSASMQPLCDLVETIWVVGGLMHPWCDLVYLADIMADFHCDVFFPQFPGVPNEIQEENGVTFKFDVFKREICGAE
ncbi:unnamed protein product, partial [Coregonus sp. 'balchen']